jgi:integrase
VARRVQTVFPDWWKDLDIPERLRAKLRAMFTITRDGYTIWYKGRPRFVAKSVPAADVEEAWSAKRKEIDTGVVTLPGIRTYREVLSEFLAAQKARVGAAKHKLSERSYHNYVVTLNDFGNFIHDRRKIADMDIRLIGPAQFSAYAINFKDWKPSAFDSVVSRTCALFRWAVEMEYIDRFKTGPQFRRPDKQEIRDVRIESDFSLTPASIAKAYDAAGHTMRCWIALGICAAFVNADVANVTRQVMDLDSGVVDFRRRKTGRVRRVAPLPEDVTELLRKYHRPDPAEPAYADYFFLSDNGRPYSVTKNANGKPSCSISRMIARLLTDADVKRPGVNFKSFRTSFFNLAPRGEWEMERKIIMGRAQGTIDMDHYLEDVGLDRLRHVVNHVWSQVLVEIHKLNSERRHAGRRSSPAA